MDPTVLNKNILRRHYPMKTVEEIASRVAKSKYFTLLDCKRGFWQIKVSDRSQKYLAFSTPWGRYTCLRLPFGLSSAPEVFSEAMTMLLQGIENTESSMDDILVHAETVDQLNVITKKVIETLVNAGLKLNKEKCIFQQKSIKFLGHIFSDTGLKADPDKIKAIELLEIPQNKQQLQRLLGMVTYLNKFIPNLSMLTEPLRKLLPKDVEWVWSSDQSEAFNKIKTVLSEPPVLRFFDVNKDVKLSVDASSVAMGAVLLQDDQPVAYATKTLTASQRNYPQIEKEALAIKFACNKFHQYVYGKKLVIESDHKPLEIIFKKPLQSAPARLQRILFDVIQYSPEIVYVKGAELHIADTLSRDCKKIEETDDEREMKVHIILPMSDSAMERFKNSTQDDEELQALRKLINEGWPDDKNQIPRNVRNYFNFRDELALYNNLLFKGEKLIVPKAEIAKVLADIHSGHPGIQSSIRRARQFLFWLGQSTDVQQYVEKCTICQQTQRSKDKEPIFEKEIPSLPWQIVGTDLFHFKNNEYIIVADHYSGYFDFKKLKSTTSIIAIEALKKWFATHGVPEVLESDNGPQFSSSEFREFQNNWNFRHQTSSPGFPRSNGFIERHVQTAKSI